MTQRILALDDELDMLKLLERIVTEKTPYEIVTTNNAIELPALLDRTPIDLILTDLKMPGMDGMDVLRLVKERGSEQEVIIMTAFGSLDSAVEALSHGVFDYLTKPFKKEQMIVTVDRAMRWHRLKQDARRDAAIFETEPYVEAERAFLQEYIRRLEARCAGDRRQALERAGLTDDAFQQALKGVHHGS